MTERSPLDQQAPPRRLPEGDVAEDTLLGAQRQEEPGQEEAPVEATAREDRRRASLHREIRAGWQRALGH